MKIGTLVALSLTIGTYGMAQLKMTSGGIGFKDTKPGQGSGVTQGNKVKIYYKGKTENNHVFIDNSAVSGKPPAEFTVGVGQFLFNWDDGLKGMKVGGKRIVNIPANLNTGNSDWKIPAKVPLTFDVELVSVN